MLPALLRLFSAGCAVIFLSSTQAAAQFAVCNQTLNVLNVAVGRYAYENFTTSGWWTVGPNRCANVIDRVLDVRYVYVFAQDVFGKEIMRGATPMCIDTKRFDIVGEEDCLLRGYLEARFHEVDTFKSERWTLFIYPPS
ncbi:DUF1036 domain-containing protein [Sagittula stellata]|uniref:DUF1036 domain-containing protein n=1 Tax=Sagittula stellata (strain ATCC 700073 / DSM 11524 / E-37) TaxID=388399 RepID=A3KAP7_SAGS3|nr:DUF1036 domain-containing protein [Sagittula stellata]EBA05753.1 hypothetical protein SSE37_03040 [Sagittula stellata E-37]